MNSLILLLSILLQVSLNYGRILIEPRIINGIRSDPRDFPYFVSIVFNNIGVCGGSLLSDRYELETFLIEYVK